MAMLYTNTAICMNDCNNTIYMPSKTNLLDDSINLNAQDYYGKTPLHMDIKINDYSLPNDVNPNIQDRYGNTALHMQVWAKNKNAIRLLLKHKNIDLTLRDNGGETPLTLAKKNNYYKGEQLISKILNKKFLKLLQYHIRIENACENFLYWKSKR